MPAARTTSAKGFTNRGPNTATAKTGIGVTRNGTFVISDTTTDIMTGMLASTFADTMQRMRTMPGMAIATTDTRSGLSWWYSMATITSGH